ncbi:branched-chain amino acid ABC transporter permease [Reyranella sp.]|uniref:branched-chain amino acid ABC transporter permease n=1 Tax=Reyranella sp. TaxID=1929291 RepID=UPI003D0DD6B8
MLSQQLVNALVLGSEYALIAVGFTLYFGMLNLINLAHGAVYMAGAFAAVAAYRAAIGEGFSSGLALVAMSMGGLLFASALGMLVERVAVRPLRQAPPLVFLITSIAVYLVLEQCVLVFFPNGANPQVFPDPFALRSFSFAGAVIGEVQIFVIVLALALIAGLHFIINGTRLGRQIRAITADPIGARMMGVNVDRTVGFAFALGSGLAGIGGIVEGLNFGSVSFTMGFIAGLKGFTAAVIGGLGNVYGALAGGFLLAIIEVLVSGYLPQGAAYKNVVTFALLILCLQLRPDGLLGTKKSSRV